MNSTLTDSVASPASTRIRFANALQSLAGTTSQALRIAKCSSEVNTTTQHRNEHVNIAIHHPGGNGNIPLRTCVYKLKYVNDFDLTLDPPAITHDYLTHVEQNIKQGGIDTHDLEILHNQPLNLMKWCLERLVKALDILITAKVDSSEFQTKEALVRLKPSQEGSFAELQESVTNTIAKLVLTLHSSDEKGKVIEELQTMVRNETTRKGEQQITNKDTLLRLLTKPEA